MNGRVYDPEIGRFMSADPNVQDPTNAQNLNRNTYVLNNPLSYTDPSGYFLKAIAKAFKSVAKFIGNAVRSVLSSPRGLFSVVVAVAAFWALGPGGFAVMSEVAAAGVAGAASGYVATGTLKGAVIGAGTALAFAGVHYLKAEWGITGKTIGDQIASAGMHGAVGCASSAAGGGSCASGFLSAGVANFAGPKISPLFGETYHGQLLAHATVGGIAAELGGGKFGNGFVTAAFGYMFNEALETTEEAFNNAREQGEKKLERFGRYLVEDVFVEGVAENGTISGGIGYHGGAFVECPPDLNGCSAVIGLAYGAGGKVETGLNLVAYEYKSEGYRGGAGIGAAGAVGVPYTGFGLVASVHFTPTGVAWGASVGFPTAGLVGAVGFMYTQPTP